METIPPHKAIYCVLMTWKWFYSFSLSLSQFSTFANQVFQNTSIYDNIIMISFFEFWSYFNVRNT